jgi:putative PIN family toxin of toxin-antitoxin system
MKADSDALAAYVQVVVDTNVILSAALSPNGAPALLLDELLQIGSLVFSTTTFAELETRIWLPKFDRYLPMERRRHLLQDVTGSAYWVEPSDTITQHTYSRDPKDDAFIHVALATNAIRLISGDDDLLCLNPLDDLRILTPRAALGELFPQASQ